jgi:hypothetical protein
MFKQGLLLVLEAGLPVELINGVLHFLVFLQVDGVAAVEHEADIVEELRLLGFDVVVVVVDAQPYIFEHRFGTLCEIGELGPLDAFATLGLPVRLDRGDAVDEWREDLQGFIFVDFGALQ